MMTPRLGGKLHAGGTPPSHANRLRTRLPAFDDDYEVTCRYCGQGLDASQAGTPENGDKSYRTTGTTYHDASLGEGQAADRQVEAVYSQADGCWFCGSPYWWGSRGRGAQRIR